MNCFDGDLIAASDVNPSNIESITRFDLRDISYHGGSSLGSGVLPKWDLLDKRFMVKRCTLNSLGDALTDSVNECMVSEFCNLTGISCAQYWPIIVKYTDQFTKLNFEHPATITRIFPGDLRHYRDLRDVFGYGQNNDALIDFTDMFPGVKKELNSLIHVDLIFNQVDRHAKNFGMIGSSLSPIFDSGSCLNYDSDEDSLNESLMARIPSSKTFGKKSDELLDFSLRHICNEFSIPFDMASFLNASRRALGKYKKHYTAKRFAYISRLVERRISLAGQIHSKVCG
jgi:hypothetical protein